MTWNCRWGPSWSARRGRTGQPAPTPNSSQAWAETLGQGNETGAVELGLSDQLARRMAAYRDRRLSTIYAEELEVVVERERAGYSAWYEMFPRSCSPEPGRHGTFQDCEDRLPYVAAMGFDVLYLPPIHPIGRTHRKGTNCRADGGRRRSRQPLGDRRPRKADTRPSTRNWARLADFDRLLAKAREYGMEIAMDLAYQCSPDHPYVREHPEWFRHRPDGSVQYAENPPKKYEDIYPFDFETEAWRELWEELKDVALFWVRRGVRIFRVDNPHTKPFPFWRWLIEEIQAEYPDVIFLAEAFTRPKVMYDLAKLGFSQSYTYFTWRNTQGATDPLFLRTRRRPDVREYFRPNLWPNTPDILTEYLQYGGRAAFLARLVLAATLSANYGIYGPAFELMENRAREAGERRIPGFRKVPDPALGHRERRTACKDFIRRINRIRRENAALQRDGNLRFHRGRQRSIALLQPAERGPAKHGRGGGESGPLPSAIRLGGTADRRNWASRRIGPTRSTTCWAAHGTCGKGRRNFVQLNPELVPAHILLLRRRVRTEQQFEYFM